MAKKKGNKDVLKSINYSMDIVKRVKENREFSVEEKKKILDDYVGLSEDNNSYFTPLLICYFIKNALRINKGNVADLSAGIGNMARPFIKEYGKLSEDIIIDLYEKDENNSLAGSKAWEDYSQVNFYANFDSLNGDIPDNYYDFIIGNPPFSGSVNYWCEWNHKKPKKNQKVGDAKNNNICDCFVDLSIKKTKDKGYIDLVLPQGHLFKGKATEKLRYWMKDNVSIKGIFPLDGETFSDSGVMGTLVGTVLVIMQKGTKQEEIFIGEFADKEDFKNEIDSIAKQFNKFVNKDYNIVYRSDNKNGLHGIFKEKHYQL